MSLSTDVQVDLRPDVPVDRRRWRPGLIEGLLAAVAVAISLWVLAVTMATPGFDRPNLLAYALTALGSAAVLWGRRKPLVALVISGCCATLLAWLDQHVDILPFVITGLMFMVGRNLPRRPAVAGVVIGLAGLAAAALSGPPDLGLRSLAQSMGIFVTAWVLGRLTRARGAAGKETSIAQEVAAVAPSSTSVVKAFNTIFRNVLEKGRPDVFVAGDSAPAKTDVAAFIRSLGLRPLDVGGLTMAHWLEGMGLVTVGLAGNGVGHWDFSLGVHELAD